MDPVRVDASELLEQAGRAAQRVADELDRLRLDLLGRTRIAPNALPPAVVADGLAALHRAADAARHVATAASFDPTSSASSPPRP